MTTIMISHAGYSTSKIRTIAGHTLELGLPKSKLVRIYSRNSGSLLKQIKSDADGSYKVHLPYDASYLVVAVDSNKVFNAVIQDNVVPK